MFRFISAVLFALLLAGCDDPPEFVTPLSDIGEFQYDDRLLGQWYGAEVANPEAMDVVINIGDVGVFSKTDADGKLGGEALYKPVEQYNQKILQVTRVAIGSSDPYATDYIGFPTVLDGQTYVNLALVEKPETLELQEDGTVSLSGRIETVEGAPDFRHGYLIMKVVPLTADAMVVCTVELPGGDYRERKSALRSFGLDIVWPRPTPQGDALAEEGPGRSGPAAEDANGWPVVVGGDRSALRRFFHDRGRWAFRPLYVLQRLGTQWKDPTSDPLLRARLIAQNDQCQLDELLPYEPGP